MKRFIVPGVIIILLILSLTLFRDYTINPFQEKVLVNRTLNRVSRVNITEYRSCGINYKMLFPYDFIQGDPNWGLIISKNAKYLTPEERSNLLFYLNCKEIGIDIHKESKFFIIETRLSAGFNFDQYLKESTPQYDFTNKRIVLVPPKSQVLSMEVLDKLGGENIPDLEITPGQWKDLINLILPIIETRILEQGILEKSDLRNREFLTSIYTAIGWDRVEFK